MKSVSIVLVRYAPQDGDHARTAQLVECFRDVFAERPWNEWLKCSQCQKYWGTKDAAFLASCNFRHCNAPLVDFWPRDQVIFDLAHEITPQASCWLAVWGVTVVGFCWGYPITVMDLEAKLDISFRAKTGLGGDDVVAYQDDMGVLRPYRGCKIAKAMAALRLDNFLAQGLKIGIVRTRQSPEPSETFQWYTRKLGYKILATYPGEDGRVILGRPLEGLKELLST